MPRSALACALAAAAAAALAVAEQRIGLALSAALLLVLTAGALSARDRRAAAPEDHDDPAPVALRLLPGALAVGLALQPVLRDAGWVVAVSVAAALVAGAAACAPARSWPRVLGVAVAPARLVAGNVVVARTVRALLPDAAGGRARHGAPVARGVAAAAALLATFGGLFAAADPAFANVADDLLTYEWDPARALWRVALALLFLGAAGALARVSARRAAPQEPRAPWVPAHTELAIVLAALTALFAVFVGVQLRVLFGGAAYVGRTTGLGYGEYARQGFGTLLFACALTLALVGVAARREGRVVRALLGALCGLTLVVLVSAHLRLGLVEGAYGFTRARFAGHVVVLWLGAVFVLVIAAGAHRRLAAAAPRVVLPATLAALLVLALANPDGRIATSAVERFARTGELDVNALSQLSADALPAIARLPSAPENLVADSLRARLRRPDGPAGLNLARARAR